LVKDLEVAKQFINTLIDIPSRGIIILDPHLTPIYWNSRIAEMCPFLFNQNLSRASIKINFGRRYPMK
jgi:hypothetical protein